MILSRLGKVMSERNVSVNTLYLTGKGDFAIITVRRACKGVSIKPLTAKAIAKALGVRLEALT